MRWTGNQWRWDKRSAMGWAGYNKEVEFDLKLLVTYPPAGMPLMQCAFNAMHIHKNNIHTPFIRCT